MLADFFRSINELLTVGIAITAFSLLLYALSFNLRDRVARSFALILLCVVFVSVGDAISSNANISSQILQRDRHAHYMNTLALIGGTLEKISVEIRHLQRTEVLEASEFFSKGQKGSSAMPHKKNPIVSERISGMARLLRGNAMVAMENIALWHERDISHSSVERVILPDSTMTLYYMLKKSINAYLVFLSLLRA